MYRQTALRLLTLEGCPLRTIRFRMIRCGSMLSMQPVATSTSFPSSNCLNTKAEALENVMGANIDATKVESVGMKRSN